MYGNFVYNFVYIFCKCYILANTVDSDSLLSLVKLFYSDCEKQRKQQSFRPASLGASGLAVM